MIVVRKMSYWIFIDEDLYIFNKDYNGFQNGMFTQRDVFQNQHWDTDFFARVAIQRRIKKKNNCTCEYVSWMQLFCVDFIFLYFNLWLVVDGGHKEPARDFVCLHGTLMLMRILLDFEIQSN